MEQERQVGKIVSVDSLTVYVKLDDNLKSLYKSGFHEIYPIARINSSFYLLDGIFEIFVCHYDRYYRE